MHTLSELPEFWRISSCRTWEKRSLSFKKAHSSSPARESWLMSSNSKRSSCSVGASVWVVRFWARTAFLCPFSSFAADAPVFEFSLSWEAPEAATWCACDGLWCAFCKCSFELLGAALPAIAIASSTRANADRMTGADMLDFKPLWKK